ncbi:MAG: folate-binding protein YgfZ [Solirubrobacteraceae bacterium]|nr:folate-binding protein YgfZ [Solirubrobacteraceae bacterium]
MASEPQSTLAPSPAPAEASSIEVVSLSAEAERAIRCGAALIDRSDRGKLALSGDAAAECLNGQVTQDVTKIEPGCGAYATFLTTKGQMLGDVRIVRTADTFELDTERVSLQALFDALRVGVLGHDAELHKRTIQRGLISLIGPRAKVVAQVEDLGGCEFRNAPFTVDGVPAHVIVTDVGVDILCEAELTEQIIASLKARGAVGISPAEAEVVRLERGRPRYGVELGERTMPQEAGLNDRAVSFTKGCYVGQETVARLFYRGSPNKVLRGLRFAQPPSGDGTVKFGEKAVGEVKLVAESPRVGMVALALLRVAAEPGSTVHCGGAEATVVELPFVRDDRALACCKDSSAPPQDQA